MSWIEQNLDAYRIIAEILDELRSLLQRNLEAAHGSKWHQVSIPNTAMARMIERKEKEKAVDWHISEYTEILYYATFADLLEMAEDDPGCFPALSHVAEPAMLHTRLLELEVLRSKLATARPISEAELAFLGTFHQRYRKAVEIQDEAARTAKEAPVPQAAATTTPVQPPAPRSQAEPATARPAPVPPPAATSPAVVPLAVKPVSPPPPATLVTPPPTARPAEPVPIPATPAPPAATFDDLGPPQLMPLEPAAGMIVQPAQPAAAAPAAPATSPLEVIRSALLRNDNRTILRELYREVTAIAEGIWASNIPPPPELWNEVRTSPWYTASFTRLNLQPLSDFHAIITQVEQKMRGGLPRDQLQEFLKAGSFAKTLLALRDMFQKNQI